MDTLYPTQSPAGYANGGRRCHSATYTDDGDDDAKCGGGGDDGSHRDGGVVSEMCKAVVFRSRCENGSAPDCGRLKEARAGGILCCGGTTVKVEHPLISTRVSRTTETFTGHEGKEGSPNPALALWGPSPNESHRHLCLNVSHSLFSAPW
jgi:hypothetical protein